MSKTSTSFLQISEPRARQLGIAAVIAVATMEMAAAWTCGATPEAADLAIRLALLLIPLSPALLALFTPNPLCAVVAAIPVALFISYAYYIDCLRPYQGGGASMIYVAVWFYGLLCSAAAAILAIPVLRLFRVRVVSGRADG